MTTEAWRAKRRQLNAVALETELAGRGLRSGDVRALSGSQRVEAEQAAGLRSPQSVDCWALVVSLMEEYEARWP